jgi:hypothetical protein
MVGTVFQGWHNISSYRTQRADLPLQNLDDFYISNLREVNVKLPNRLKVTGSLKTNHFISKRRYFGQGSWR